MIMKFIAAAALSVVSAADVPLFSSNDDYDEINLNIRMLSNATTEVETTIAASVKVTATFPASTTIASLDASTEFKLGCKNALEATTALANSVVTVGTISAASRRARARALTVSLDIAIAYTAKFASLALANTAVAAVASGSASAFQNELMAAGSNGLAAKLASASFGSVTVTGVTSEGGSVATGGGAAAAPSPSPSSNAAKVAVSTLAAFAAFMASLM